MMRRACEHLWPMNLWDDFSQTILEMECLDVEMLWAEDPDKQENSPWTGEDS